MTKNSLLILSLIICLSWININPGFSQKSVSKIYALCIGIERFKQNKNFPRLPGSNKDCISFVEFLKSKYSGKISSKNILALYDEKATTVNIVKGFKDFLGKAKENDIVYFYITSHGGGVTGKIQNKYIVTYDTFAGDPEGSALMMSDIPELIYALKAERVVGFISTCYGGSCVELFKEYKGKRNGKKVAIIAASQKGNLDWFVPKVGGFFGISVLLGIKGGADFNRDKIITISELVRFLKISGNYVNPYSQKPVFFISGMNNYVISRGDFFKKITSNYKRVKKAFKFISDLFK